jgi:hypothetical protein
MQVESLASLLVIERSATAVRYLCAKCKHMFWGSPKRAKEHLLAFLNRVREPRGGGGSSCVKHKRSLSHCSTSVKGCTEPLTADEFALLTSAYAGAYVGASGAYAGIRQNTSELRGAARRQSDMWSVECEGGMGGAGGGGCHALGGASEKDCRMFDLELEQPVVDSLWGVGGGHALGGGDHALGGEGYAPLPDSSMQPPGTRVDAASRARMLTLADAC